MKNLYKNPEYGRRSGDVWSVPCKNGTEVHKGDLIFIDRYGYAITATSDLSVNGFLGVADEGKSADEKERNIVVLSTGVFPFNKIKGEPLILGDGLKVVDNNTLTFGYNHNIDNVVAICYSSCDKDSDGVLAKIITQLCK
jgi:hypothetical protein